MNDKAKDNSNEGTDIKTNEAIMSDIDEFSTDDKEGFITNVNEIDSEANLSARVFTEILDAGVAQILDAFERKLAYDDTKQQQIDRLHAELQKHQADLIAKTNRPLINGLIRLHDDVGKLVNNLKRRPDEELAPSRFYKAFADVQDDIEILLDQNGVVSFTEQGEILDPRRQRVVRQIQTPDEKLNGTIAERLRKGFEQADDLIQKERVSVYVADKSSIHQKKSSDNETETEQSRINNTETSGDLEE